MVQSLAQFFSSPKTSALVSQLFAKATCSQSQNLLVMTAISRFPRAPCAFSLPVAPFFCNSRRLPPSHLPGHVGRAARQRRVPSVFHAPPSLRPDYRISSINEAAFRQASAGSILSMASAPLRPVTLPLDYLPRWIQEKTGRFLYTRYEVLLRFVSRG